MGREAREGQGGPQAPAAGAPGPVEDEVLQDVPTACLLCERPLLTPARVFLGVRVAKYMPPGDATDVAEVVEYPAGESDWVAVCSDCSMTPLWIVAGRAIRARDLALEAARGGKPS